LCIDKTYPPVARPLWNGEVYDHDRIRIGYFSADFHDHPTAHLMSELFELHDRNAFDVTAFSFGPPSNDPMRQRLEKAFEHFVDVRTHSDYEIAALARSMEIDIAIDLKGFTQNARLGIFAHRFAPVQVNYLGYPGTMGASYIDYLIADPILIPEEDRQYYAEAIAWMPNSYQVNDSKRAIAETAFTRQQLGLPESGFVFCCFNNNYKILPDVFDCWMRLLHLIEGSVLWLLEGNPQSTDNLRLHGKSRGIDEHRLVFAPRMDQTEHLARQANADLFLDTLPCNAHTTASDALWAGLPLITCVGNTFAGRVAASLLHAVNLPELITYSIADYEALALTLARDKLRLSAIRDTLLRNRTTTSLFNTRQYAMDLESIYSRMAVRYRSGLTPSHLTIES
jgi:predicted O-linked N-acetylglucosamine transferase (SPINDLY family)